MDDEERGLEGEDVLEQKVAMLDLDSVTLEDCDFVMAESEACAATVVEGRHVLVFAYRNPEVDKRFKDRLEMLKIERETEL